MQKIKAVLTKFVLRAIFCMYKLNKEVKKNGQNTLC